MPNAHGDINPFLDEIHDPVEQKNGCRDARVPTEEVADDGASAVREDFSSPHPIRGQS